ncbi:MAG: T9SS type A sorting domain-containing protein, partial [Bacteroidota bacterium]|nr:T9SS type A sorting domain-containing protein [Bacteroidota bacterium]
QFSNNGFEQWASSTQPQAWNTLGYSGFNLCEINRSTEKVEGNYSLEMQPKLLSSLIASMIGTESMPVPGLVTNGSIDLTKLITAFPSLSNMQNTSEMDYLTMLQSFKDVLSNGLSVNTLPTSINGYYKFEPLGEELFVAIAYTKTTVADSSIISGGGVYYTSQATSAFETFSLPMHYLIGNSNNTELYFVALIVETNMQATEYGRVKIDNITINYDNLSSSVIEKEKEITAYPNPTNNNTLYLNTNAKEVSIFDIMGRKVEQINNYQAAHPIHIEKSGAYIIKVDNQSLRILVR